jgi:DHA1 family multidrug resistance protein-like MFS transporter
VSQRDLLADRSTLAMLGLLVVFQVMVMASWPSLALYVGKLGVPRASVATTTGLVIFVAGVPAMFMSTTWARLGARFGVRPMLLASLVLAGVSYAAVGFLVSGIKLLFALRIFSGFVLAGFVPLTFHWMSMRAPERARGRMAGLAATAMMLGNVIGPLLGGWLAVHLDLASTFYVPGTAVALIGIAFAGLSAARRA